MGWGRNSKLPQVQLRSGGFEVSPVRKRRVKWEFSRSREAAGLLIHARSGGTVLTQTRKSKALYILPVTSCRINILPTHFR